MKKWLDSLWLKFLDTYGPKRKLLVVESDTPPTELPLRDLVLAREDGDDWAIAFQCPCGCGRRIELLVVPEARPRWNYSLDKKERPSLSPSVWLKDGCKSHFWVRNGRVQWAE